MTEVSLEAIDALLAAAEASAEGELTPGWDRLLDRQAAARHARAYKVDVSFALLGRGEGGARFSVNDTGEEVAFRSRLRGLGLPTGILEPFLDASPPGRVQCTLGVKWGDAGGAPARWTLYHEELFRGPDGALVMGDLAARFGWAAPPPREGLSPGAVAIDLVDGAVVALKDYWIATEREQEAAVRLPEGLESFRRSTPFREDRGTRRYLVARRWARGGVVTGHKLLWMSEAQDDAGAARAWAFVDRAREALRLPTSRPARAMDALRAGWMHEARLYPDLVSLDLDAASEPSGLTVYVSIK